MARPKRLLTSNSALSSTAIAAPTRYGELKFGYGFATNRAAMRMATNIDFICHWQSVMQP